MQLPDPETCRALARAVVAAGKWRWLRGMLDTEDRDVCRVLADGTAEYWPGVGYNEPLPADALPDFTDPLTAAGALLVARKVWNNPTLCVSLPGGVTDWRAALYEDSSLGSRVTVAIGPTELEALIAAILAAPETKP